MAECFCTQNKTERRILLLLERALPLFFRPKSGCPARSAAKCFRMGWCFLQNGRERSSVVLVDEPGGEQLLFLGNLFSSDLPGPEDVRDGNADGDADDDGHGLDAVAECLQQDFRADVIDVEEGEEQAVEQDAGDEGNGGRRCEDDVRHMEPMDGREGDDADNAAADEGSGGLAESEVEHADVSQEDRNGAADGDGPENAPRNVEEKGEAACRDGCGKGMIEVNVAGA